MAFAVIRQDLRKMLMAVKYKSSVFSISKFFSWPCDLFGLRTLTCLGPFLCSVVVDAEALRNEASSRAKSTGSAPTCVVATFCQSEFCSFVLGILVQFNT